MGGRGRSEWNGGRLCAKSVLGVSAFSHAFRGEDENVAGGSYVRGKICLYFCWLMGGLLCSLINLLHRAVRGFFRVRKISFLRG